MSLCFIRPKPCTHDKFHQDRVVFVTSASLASKTVTCAYALLYVLLLQMSAWIYLPPLSSETSLKVISLQNPTPTYHLANMFLFFPWYFTPAFPPPRCFHLLVPLRRVNISFVFQTGPLLKVTKGTNELLYQANCHKPRLSQANSDVWSPFLQNLPCPSLGCLSSDSFSSIYSLNVSQAVLCCHATPSPCVTLWPMTQSPSVNSVLIPILHVQTQLQSRSLSLNVLEATPHRHLKPNSLSSTSNMFSCCWWMVNGRVWRKRWFRVQVLELCCLGPKPHPSHACEDHYWTFPGLNFLTYKMETKASTS